MKTNLIQSYSSSAPAVQKYNSQKAEKNFDVQKELSTRTFIKPLPSNGHLVRTNIFDAPAEFFKDAKYDFNAFKHSVRGEANDHELGRLNDIGMKLGGLAIASYLYARKQTPLTKVMEFVGLGSFFAAMDIWPKLALQLPAYLIHGVNVRQQYVDNYGRKKLFYLDHQFIPWDLYSDEEINKIGDRMGVPKDMKNRRDFIQEKMRKIALQNNTLWMLTSGFATPIMSALICNALEQPIQNYQREHLLDKANKLMTNFPQEIKKYDFSKNLEHLESIFAKNKGESITPEIVDEILKTMTEDFDAVTAASIENDVRSILPSMHSFSVGDSAIESVVQTLKNNFAPLKLSDEILASIVPDKQTIENALNEKGLLSEGIQDFSEHIKVIQSLLLDKIDDFVQRNPDSPVNSRLNLYAKKLIHSKNYGEFAQLTEALRVKHSAILNEDVIQRLRSALSILNDLRSEIIVLDKYSYIKYAQAPETILADDWNAIARNLLEPLGITKKEIEQTRFDRKLVAKLLREKFEYIVSDDLRYSNVITALQKELSTLPDQRTFEDFYHAADTTKKEIGDTIFRDKVETVFNQAAEALRKSGLYETADALVGFDKEGTTSLKHLHLQFVQDRVMGVKSSFYRILNTLDFYHRISKVEYIDHVLTSTMPREVKEELVELCKNLLISGHSSDYAVKFYARRNLERNPWTRAADYYSQIETEAGRVVNRYLGKLNPEELVELSNDKNFFEAAMKLMYDGELHPDTMAKIKDALFMEDFMNYRHEILKYLGGDKYFAKPNHLVNGHECGSSSMLRMLLLGCAPDEMVSKLARQRYNSAKWLKMFGTLGASVLGITVFSQFFLGKMAKSEKENR